LTEIKHGTEWGWRQCKGENGVACDACREAKYAAEKKRRENNRSKTIPAGLHHGLYVAYYYSCTCEICLSETRSRAKDRKRRSRARRKEAHS